MAAIIAHRAITIIPCDHGRTTTDTRLTTVILIPAAGSAITDQALELASELAAGRPAVISIPIRLTATTAISGVIIDRFGETVYPLRTASSDL